jgi:hypothetical protein
MAQQSFKTLAHEDFSDLPVGPFPSDYSPLGEYHYRPPLGRRGRWYQPTTSSGWRPHAAWLVFEGPPAAIRRGGDPQDRSRHRMLQTLLPDKRFPRILVTGDPDWSDYTLAVVLQPLRTDGFAGMLFRYQTSRTAYRLGFEGGNRLVLYKDDEASKPRSMAAWSLDHREHPILAEAVFEYSCDRSYRLEARVEGDKITALVEETPVLETRDASYPRGRAGIVATTTAIFDSLEVTAAKEVHAAYVQTRDRKRRELDELRESLPKPVVWRKLSTKGFGAGRNIRFGHLRGRKELEIVLAQTVPFMPGNDSMMGIRALTAIDLRGNVLWQVGEPSGSIDAALTTCDLPVQVYDIDGDGSDEVLCLRNFHLHVLSGKDGSIKKVFALPSNPREENRFGRLMGDAIIIANFRGLKRPRDIVVKNRYKQVWAYDDKWNLLWTDEFRNTGHFPVPYDFDGQGRDDMIVGYARVGADGTVKWNTGWEDHADEIAIGRFDPARNDVLIAMAAGEAGFNILRPDGEVLHRRFLGHAQRLSAAKFRKDIDGLQFYVVTFWGHAGIISLHDCRGNVLLEFEPTTTGSVLNPVNWTGDGVEFALISGSRAHGGMIDGHGRRAVVFPDDGHPQLCAEALNLTGDARDEVVLWDNRSMWIYTQDRPAETKRVYKPVRYPHWNASNYRAEISLPGWEASKPRGAP